MQRSILYGGQCHVYNRIGNHYFRITWATNVISHSLISTLSNTFNCVGSIAPMFKMSWASDQRDNMPCFMLQAPTECYTKLRIP